MKILFSYALITVNLLDKSILYVEMKCNGFLNLMKKYYN